MNQKYLTARKWDEWFELAERASRAGQVELVKTFQPKSYADWYWVNKSIERLKAALPQELEADNENHA